MFSLRNISIKWKLTLIIMASSTVALLLASSGFVAYELFTSRATMTRDLSTLADIIGNRSTAAPSSDNQADAQASLNSLKANKHIVSACLYKGDKVFASYSRDGNVGIFPKPEQDGARFADDHLILFREIVLQGESAANHAARLRAGGPRTLYLKADLREMYQRFKLYGGMIAIFMLASLAVTFVLSSLLQRVITKPIEQLARTAKIVSTKKNYSVRAQKYAQDELGDLMDGFNEMLTQIQQRDGALQDANDQLEKRVWARTQDLRGEIEERQRAEAASQEQLSRISLLNQITQIISERQDLSSILHVVLRQLEDRLTVDFGGVCLFDPQAATLNVAALRVKNPLLVSKLDLHEGSVLSLPETGLLACQQGETVYLPDSMKARALLAEKFAHAGLRSVSAVPLMAEDKLFGVLMVARLEPNSFSSGECEFLRMLSEHVALAAHQAQLHSELEQAYNELRQSQQTVMQQERLKALGQMASGIAHDINNALSPVVGFADLLVNSEPSLTANGKKSLNYIKMAGEDIAHIVARLREFYRSRDERESLFSLNLNQLGEQVIAMTRPRWRDIPQGRGVMIEMQTDFDPALPELTGIESEVREALTNLVLNAVDAIPNGGKITVRTHGVRERTAEGKKKPTHAVVEVTDTGVGMNEETRNRCLEPFFSTKGKRGTGLGLAMVYGVMERHEGKIEILSELGKGTTMRLVFPIRKALPSDALADLPLVTPASPQQILCIDDEPQLRELLKQMLEREGHQVEVTDGGQAGLDAFRAAHQRGKPFDVVITDLGMPYLDGRQVAKTLKRESPHTPIIMLTGWGAFMKQDGEEPAEVDEVLSKPPRSKELRETLFRVTQKQRASQAAEAAPASV